MPALLAADTSNMLLHGIHQPPLHLATNAFNMYRKNTLAYPKTIIFFLYPHNLQKYRSAAYIRELTVSIQKALLSKNQLETTGSARMTIVCCICGSCIDSNALNMCATCTAQEIDVMQGIPKVSELVQCPKCLRYQSSGTIHQPIKSKKWFQYDLESRELMGFALKSVPALKKLKLIDAEFVWTEPHSKRLKVKITFQKDVEKHATVQASTIITYRFKNLKCSDCCKQYHDVQWRALVQLRQKASHKRTLLKLEQNIVKCNAQEEAIQIRTTKDGIDFYFLTKGTAERFLHYVSSQVLVRVKTSDKLVSEDIRNGKANMQTTMHAELSPICKDDLLILPSRTAQSCGGISRLVLCDHITSILHVMDPQSGRTAEISAEKYWKIPFQSLVTTCHMIDFVVLDIDLFESRQSQQPSAGIRLAELEIARVSDFGVNETTFFVRSHLGALLHSGDYVSGYNLTSAIFGTQQMDGMNEDDLPNIVLVRKSRLADPMSKQ